MKRPEAPALAGGFLLSFASCDDLMMAEERIAGTIAAAVTPLRERGERLDEGALEALIDFYRTSGIDGVLVLGTTGEGILLDHDERCRVAEQAAAAARDLRML